MRERLLKGLFLVLGILVLVFPFTVGLADAGHHSSYSSGGSSHSSSSHSSSSHSSSYSSSRSRSSSSSSSSSSSGSPLAILIIVIVVIIIIVIISNSKTGGVTNRSNNHYSIKLMTQEEIDTIDPSIKIKETMDKVFDLYVKEQVAWMNNDYKMQLETMELGMEKNMMEDIVMVDGGIISIRNTDLTQELKVKLHVRMKDYIINTADGKPKHGDPNKIMDNNYIITLERSRREEIHNCPNCGGELKDNASEKCKYCDAVLVKGSKDFVIVKQENVQGMYQ